MKKEVEHVVDGIWQSIGIDRPINHNHIVEFCYNDVKESADPENWHSGDVAISFRRWMELSMGQEENQSE